MEPTRTTRGPSRLRLRGIRWADVPREVSAGITLAALIIPLNIGYAQVAGLPPVVGLYAAIIPLVVFALFTSSRHVVGSPDASIAALVGAALLAFAGPEDPLRVQYAQALAAMCGLLFFVFWYFRLAFLANFLSRAVMVGFISGLGIEVFTNQIRKILGASAGTGSEVLAFAHQIKDAMASSVDTEGYFVELLALLESIPRANWYSVAIGLGALVIVRLLKRYAPRVPGALVALILLTTIVAAFNLDKKGVSVLGAIPSGPPALSVPAVPVADYLGLLPGALAVVAITLCEGLLLVRQYSRKHGYKADGDQVLFAYGVANLAAGLSGALVTGNSPSRSAAMESAGSRSQLPSVIAAGTIALVMLFFTDTVGVPAQRGPGRDCGQRRVVADRGGRVAGAVPDAPQRVLDRRCVPAERAGVGAAAGRRDCFPAGHHRCHSASCPARHLGPARSPGRQPFCAHGDRRRAR